jgi:predicted Zn-dependent peptidase
MVISVAGNVEHADVVRQVRKIFADRLDNSAGRVSIAPARPTGRRSRITPKPVTVIGDDTEQANMIVGTLGLSRHDRRRFALGVLSSALGGGMSSRLFQRIREERGLAYSVYSFAGSYADTGQFGVYAGCQPGKAEEVLGLINTELSDIAAGGLSEAEILRGKGQMRGGIVLGLEDSGSRMTRIGKSELIYGNVIGVDDLIARVDSVSLDEVTDVAALVLSQPRCLTVVGPFGPHDFDAVA